MGEREYRWSDRGRRSARSNGVEPVEGIDALAAPAGLRVERQVDDLVAVQGMAASGRVILVVAERISGNLNVFRIVFARPLGRDALDRWSRELLSPHRSPARGSGLRRSA